MGVLLDQFATKSLTTGTRRSVLHMDTLVRAPNALGHRCRDGLDLDRERFALWQMRMRDCDKGWKF